MKLKQLAPFGCPLAFIAVLALSPGAASAASPEVAAALKTIETMPADAPKFAAYCSVLGEMEAVEDDQAKYDALEDKLTATIDAYGTEMSAAWDKIGEISPETDDGKVVTTAVDAMDEKCP